MIRSWTRCSVGLLLACAALCLGVAVSATAAVAHFRHESYQAFQGQLSAGRIHAASFNKKAHTLHLSLTNGRHMLVSYPSRDESRLASRLRAHGASVLVKRPKVKAVHHTLRYVAGGVLVLVIAVVAYVLLSDRRRRPASGTEPAVHSRSPVGPEPPAGSEAAVGSQSAIEPGAEPAE